MIVWALAASFETAVTTQRGFVYHLDGDTYVITSEPNLKSCCIGSQKRRDTQIFFSSEEKLSIGRAMTFQGRLVQEKDRLVLKDARVISREGSLFYWILGFCGVPIFLLYWWMRR